MEGSALELRLAELHAVLIDADTRVYFSQACKQVLKELVQHPDWFPELSDAVKAADKLWDQRNGVIHAIWLHGQEGEVRTCLRPKLITKQRWIDIPKVTWTIRELLELAEGLRVAGTPIAVAALSGRPLASQSHS